MAIPQDQIKILKSERLADTDDGGGRITGNEVVDGVPNDVFPDIGDVDRATGRVRLRKLYGGAQSANTDLFVNGNVMVARPPSDPNTHVSVFDTGDWADERQAAQGRLESYLAAGPITSLTMLGTQIEGQSAVICYGREGLSLPEVGETLVLSEENLQTGDVTAQQYVRITDITAEAATFTDAQGDFQRLIVTIELSSPLKRDFPGVAQVARNTVGQVSPTLIRTTRVAAAQRYYGITALAEQPTPGEFTARGASIFTQLVPSTTAEDPLVDQPVASLTGAGEACGDPITIQATSIQVDAGATQTVYAGRSILPGSLSVEIEGSDSSDDLFIGEDDGIGGVTRTGGGQDTASASVGVDYESGAVTFVGISPGATITRVRLTFTPAAFVRSIPEADLIEISEGNRGTSYTRTLLTTPAPGTMAVSYRALGKWYTLTDQGNGTLKGEAGTGAGSFNFATRTLLLTLGIEPDIGSIIIITYGQTAEILPQPGTLAEDPAFTLEAGDTIAPGSATITWSVGGTDYSATDSSGTITGDATGTVDYAAGSIRFLPNTLPPEGTAYTLDFETPNGAQPGGAPQNPSVNGTTASFTIPGAPLEPGSVSATFDAAFHVDFAIFNPGGLGSTVYAKTVTESFSASDNGTGFLTINGIAGNGTVDYATGDVTINVTGQKTFDEYSRVESNGQTRFAHTKGTAPADIQAITAISYRQEDPGRTAGQVTNDGTAMVATISDAGSYVGEPGTLAFRLGGEIYIDRDGTLYNQHDVGTDAATSAGSVNYAGRTITITSWPQAAPSFAAIAAALRMGDRLTGIVAGRAPAQRLRPESFQLIATRDDGTQLIGQSQPDGSITNAGGTISGSVDYEMAWFEAVFYEDDGITPAVVLGATARYNAVGQSSLPIDAAILGLDPVRLPLDGRVPMFRPGGLAAVHYTGEDPLPDPFGPNDSHQLPHDALTWARLKDQAGAYVDTQHYSTDLDAGTVTASPTADFSAYTQPLIAEYRIEDMAVVQDAELGGRLTLTKPITHTFPVPGSYISSVLVLGDLQARAYGVFDQETWTGEYSDEVIGDPVGDAELNTAAYPITVTNQGAVKDRWALVFTNANSYQIIGEITGNIGTGTTSADCEPINPSTGVPYFRIPWQAWGGGWSQGNVVRFNTDGANHPFWTAFTVMPSDPAPGDIDFKLEFRGNAD